MPMMPGRMLAEVIREAVARVADAGQEGRILLFKLTFRRRKVKTGIRFCRDVGLQGRLTNGRIGSDWTCQIASR